MYIYTYIYVYIYTYICIYICTTCNPNKIEKDSLFPCKMYANTVIIIITHEINYALVFVIFM